MLKWGTALLSVLPFALSQPLFPEGTVPIVEGVAKHMRSIKHHETNTSERLERLVNAGMNKLQKDLAAEAAQKNLAQVRPHQGRKDAQLVGVGGICRLHMPWCIRASHNGSTRMGAPVKCMDAQRDGWKPGCGNHVTRAQNMSLLG